MADSPTLRVEPTDIPGLLVVHLVVHHDSRGWFKENWQRRAMTAAGLPDFGPVQNNISFNDRAGVTRGMHAEPWEKFVSVAHGRILGAWVDLREGPTFGRSVSLEMGPETAVFIPRGVANGYQCLTDDTAYSYLVNDHWSPAARESYTFVNLADPALGIDWPVDPARAEMSEADRNHPPLAQVTPMPGRRTVVLGGSGQLGRALAQAMPEAEFPGRDLIDLSRPESIDAYDWSSVGTVVNAAAHTGVDAAEQDRAEAWAVNVTGVRHLVEVCRRHRIRLVHVSSDYVFDGSREVHDEDEPFSPLGFYGLTKAAGDELVSSLDDHIIVRTSWVVGQGRNFVATMVDLARRGISPTVVDDQWGRLTFCQDLAAGIVHLLADPRRRGTYNLTNTGPAHSWAQVADQVFTLLGATGSVAPVSTAEYTRDRPGAPRPRHSTLDTARIESTGFTPPPADDRLAALVADLADPPEATP